MVSFSSTNTESVWELDEHRFVYIVEPPQRGGYGVIRVSVDTIWTSVSPGSERGSSPHSEKCMATPCAKSPRTHCNEIGVGGRSSVSRRQTERRSMRWSSSRDSTGTDGQGTQP